MRNTLTCLVAALATAGTAQAQDIWSARDSEWITVTGPVGQVTPDRFMIDYGAGMIPVEMDGFAADSAARLRAGDWVTVSGRIDDALWERRSIEASSVYSSRLQERLRASARDDEGDVLGYTLIDTPDQGEWVGVTGEVVSTSMDGSSAVIDTGPMTLRMDLTGLSTPMLADRGDWISVYGRLDDADLWDARELEAVSVVILNQG
jgi:uncharacterized protein YdeI (BOF family)